MKNTSQRAHVVRTGLAGLTEHDLHEVVLVVQFETEPLREAIHHLLRVSVCDRDVRVRGTYRLGGECLCRDLLADEMLEVDRFLVSRPPGRLRNPPGAVRMHVRKRVVDWTRRRRVAMGALARPDRLRTGALAAILPDAYHVALLVHLANEAGSIAPLRGEAALVHRLAGLLAEEFGGASRDHLPRVTASLPVVEAACRRRTVSAASAEAARVDWYERYIEEPLGRRLRGDEASLDPTELGGTPFGRAGEAADERAEMAVATVLRVLAASDEIDAVALRRAAAELVRTRLLSAVAAAQFVADPGRLAIAAEQARVLLAS
jgi:hypothetical protein